MDRNTVIAFVLIGLILMVWMWITVPPPKKQIATTQDTIIVHTPKDSLQTTVPAQATTNLTAEDTLGKFFAPLAIGEKKIFYVETKFYKTKISTKGACLKSWELNEYKTWDQHPVNLIDENKGGGFSSYVLNERRKGCQHKKSLFQNGDSRLERNQAWRKRFSKY